MITFWILALAVAIASAVWLGRPLWRERARTTALVTALLFVGGSAGLYSLWSDWQFAEAPTADNPAGMVSRLARRLERSPEDLEGWLMLGRSYAALEQYPLAQRAYRRALRLTDGKNAEALLGLGESLMLQADGEMDDLSARLFEEALQVGPASEKALFFAAIAAQRRGDRALAIERFERMLALGPPQNIRAIIETQIATLSALPAAASGTVRPAAPQGSPQAASADARVEVQVSVAPALAATVREGAVMFVFVRRVGEQGPPLAAKRLAARLPLAVSLSAADAMLPGVTFAPGETVEVSARVSADGTANPRSGDPSGRVTYVIGRDAGKALVIDGRSP